MGRGHVPERTCRGCGRKGPQAGLLRFTLVAGRLIEDPLGMHAGRGVYCCPEETCRARLEKKQKVPPTERARLTG